jgi:ATP-dependent RNA circularization protein (DNA/RNA ligase family)
MKSKHPRTFHLPWTEEMHSDDKILKSTAVFYGKEVVVTEKRDGENTSLYTDSSIHARSLTGTSHAWQDAIKAMWAEKCRDLPDGWRVVGENLYAQHSIRYENLKQWIEVFALFDEQNTALSWDETVEWCEMLGLIHVPVLWRGTWDENQIRQIGPQLDCKRQEGYVVRVTSQIPHSNWSTYVAKWVRKTKEHWTKSWIPNKIEDTVM